MAMDMDKFEAILRHMTLDELRAANRLVCARINGEHLVRTREQMARFNYGDRVSFVHDGQGRTITATVDRVNQKTLSVTEDRASGTPGKKWRVSPSMCRKVEAKPPVFSGARSAPHVPTGLHAGMF